MPREISRNTKVKTYRNHRINAPFYPKNITYDIEEFFLDDLEEVSVLIKAVVNVLKQHSLINNLTDQNKFEQNLRTFLCWIVEDQVIYTCALFPISIEGFCEIEIVDLQKAEDRDFE